MTEDMKMIAVLAPRRVSEEVIDATGEYLSALRDGNYELVWNDLITVQAAKLLSAALLPIHMYEQGAIDRLLDPPSQISQTISITSGIALAFQMDAEGMRTSLFAGMAAGLETTGWCDFSREGSHVFVDQDNAVLVAETPGIPIIMPFVRDFDGKLKVDLEALTIFSTKVSASALYEIGLRALGAGQEGSALTYFELAAELAKPHQRLRRLVLGNEVVQQLITEARKEELREQEEYVVRARDQVLRILSGPPEPSVVMDMGRFLKDNFTGYSELPNINLDEKDITCLHGLDDDVLRHGIASILVDVDPVVAQREAEKPHTAAEIADMELPLVLGGELYYLCLPFKSGVEVRTSSVPVDVSYQIIRPFMFFRKCVVVFVSAKPCSQPLLNYIKAARSTQGWAIEVIQHTELAKLLKVNALLWTDSGP